MSSDAGCDIVLTAAEYVHDARMTNTALITWVPIAAQSAPSGLSNDANLPVWAVHSLGSRQQNVLPEVSYADKLLIARWRNRFGWGGVAFTCLHYQKMQAVSSPLRMLAS